MIINIRGGDDLNFENYESFFSYVNNFIISNIKHDIDNKLYYYYEKNKKNTIKGIKKFREELKSMFYNKTILNTNYWLSRGWDEKESILLINEEQKRRSDIGKVKMDGLKNTDYKKWCETKTTRKEFYIKKGFTEEESILMLSKRQRTFSLDICISKYGDEGLEVWKERQNKWISKMQGRIFDKDSSSPEFLFKKYGDDWIIKGLNRLCFLDKELLKDIISKYGNDFKSFIIEYNKVREIINMKDAYFIYNSNILRYFFNMTKNEMIECILNTFKIDKTSYGNIRYFNNHICRSNGEYFIAKKLFENKIDYVYEKKYPNSNLICDFYINKYDLYVEYTGMLKDFMRKNQPNIYNVYKDRFDVKQKMCLDENIKMIFNTDPNKLIKNIKEYGNKN